MSDNIINKMKKLINSYNPKEYEITNLICVDESDYKIFIEKSCEFIYKNNIDETLNYLIIKKYNNSFLFYNFIKEHFKIFKKYNKKIPNNHIKLLYNKYIKHNNYINYIINHGDFGLVKWYYENSGTYVRTSKIFIFDLLVNHSVEQIFDLNKEIKNDIIDLILRVDDNVEKYEFVGSFERNKLEIFEKNIEYLLNNFCEVNINSIIQLVISTGLNNIFCKYLITKKEIKNINLTLTSVLSHGSFEMLNKLTTLNVSVRQSKYFNFHLPSTNFNTLKLLVDCGCKMQGKNLLTKYIQNKQYESIEYMINKGYKNGNIPGSEFCQLLIDKKFILIDKMINNNINPILIKNFYNLLDYEYIFNYIKQSNIKIDISKCRDYINLNRSEYLFLYSEYRKNKTKEFLQLSSNLLFIKYLNLREIFNFNDIPSYIINILLNYY